MTVLDRFAELGGRFIDTAPSYGDGAAERVVGRWLRSSGARMQIGSKAGLSHVDPSLAVLDPETMLRSVHDSLERLGIPRLAWFWLHRDEPAMPVEAISSTVTEILTTGLAASAGCSNWTVERIGRLMALGTPIAGLQPLWSLARLERSLEPWLVEVDAEHLSFAARENLLLFPYRCLALGFFNRRVRDGDRREIDEFVARSYASARNDDRRRRVERIAAEHGTGVNAIALAFLLGFGSHVNPIVGASTPEQLTESMRATRISLSPSERAYLSLGQTL